MGRKGKAQVAVPAYEGSLAGNKKGCLYNQTSPIWRAKAIHVRYPVTLEFSSNYPDKAPVARFPQGFFHLNGKAAPVARIPQGVPARQGSGSMLPEHGMT
eukprot:772327-Pelagomonas_calceolata.AAC.3